MIIHMKNLLHYIVKRTVQNMKQDRTIVSNHSYGLLDGDAGILLFMLYYNQLTHDSTYKKITYNFAEKLLYNIAKNESKFSYCSGIAGELYLFDFLKYKRIIGIDIKTIQKHSEEFLLYKLENCIQNNNYDLLHGAIGIVLYFLNKKAHKSTIIDFVDFIYNTAQKDFKNKIFKWESIIDYDKNYKVYNLSMAHGIASIILFFSKLIQCGIATEKIQQILIGAANYILSQKRDITQFGSIFPNYIPLDNNEKIHASKLAWCNGDIGIGYSLWKAGNTLRNINLIQEGLKILLQSASRKNKKSDTVKDTCICHGTAGLSMMYKRIYINTLISVFKSAESYWLTQTLNVCHKNQLTFFRAPNIWAEDYTLLSGTSGVGLVLLSNIYQHSQNWNELFLMN